MTFLKKNYGWMLVAVLAIIPLFILSSMVEIRFVNGLSISLTEAPIGQGKTTLEMLYHISGEFSIRWMTLVLSCTPFYIIFGITNLFVRQAMGIATAVWSFVHFSIFIIAEGFFETFTQLNYVAGFVAVLILIPLFMTSNRRSMKWLNLRWKKIQSMAYVAMIFTLLHVALLDRTWIIYCIIVSLGFIIRIPFIKYKLVKLRTNKL